MASNIAFQGIAHCPPSKYFNQGSIYIFGIFAAPETETIPDEVKTVEFLTALYTPAGVANNFDRKRSIFGGDFTKRSETVALGSFFADFSCIYR